LALPSAPNTGVETVEKRRPGRPRKVKTQEDLDREEAERIDLKKRGRKREKWDVYKENAEKKIEALR